MKKLIMLFVCCVLFVATGVTVYAESGVQVTDANGQTQVYNEMVTNIVLNGETKTLGKSPAVIVEGEVMAPPIAVFKKILGMSVTLNSNKKTVVLKTTEHTMELTANSKIAILDGEEMTLDIAPVFGTYMGTGTKSTLLPLKEIAKIWSYTYEFNEDTNAISLTRTGGMELTYAGLSFYYQKTPVTLLINGKEVESSLHGIRMDDYTMVPAWKMAKELGIKYSYSSSKKQITLSYKNQKIVMTMNSTKAKVNGQTTTMEAAPVYVKNRTTGASGNMIPAEFMAENLGIPYTWDDATISVNFKKPTESMKGYQIAISLPEKCKNGNYTVNDDYYNDQYQIILNGNYKSFYELNPVENSTSLIKSTSVTVEDGKTRINLKANTIKGYQIKEVNGILYVKVGTPKEIYDKIVVLDAGHGGTDPGAAGNGIYEKDCTLNILKAAKKYFDKDGTIKVYYTRTTNTQSSITSGSSGLNTSTSLRARTDLANTVNADLFISVHINSASNTSARGTEVYYSSSNNRKNSGGLTASKLAQYAYDDMLSAVGSLQRGVKTANFYVVRYTNMPAILIETAFISNKEDAAILKSSEKIDQMGKAVYQTVSRAFSNYPTGR